MSSSKVRELAVAAQDFGHVRFIRQLRVHLCPVVSRTNEGEIGHQEFERGVANSRANGCACAGGVAWRQEHDRQRVEEIGLALSARLRQPTAKRHTLETLEHLLASARPSGSGRRNISITCSTVSGLASASPAGRPWPMRKPTCRTMQ